MPAAAEPWVRELVERLTAAVNGEKDRVVAEFAARTGLSAQTLYRKAKRHGYTSGRKPRADKGSLKSGLTDDQVDHLAALIATTARENKGGIMPAELALKLAADNGIIERGQVSPSTLQRILREREISKKHLREQPPHVHLRSLHPNHVHVVDVSVCIQYYLRGGKTQVMREAEFYKNKPANFAKVKTRLLRYVVTDHFSGAFWLKYFDTTGETADNLFHFLVEAWCPKADDRLPFRGVPLYLLEDAGSANLSGPVSAFLDALGIERPKSLPHNPRRQGGTESMHNVIEQWFESRLKIQPAASVEQLNAWALDFQVWFQAEREHTRTGLPRTALWSTIRPEHLREVADVALLRDCYARPEEERTVDGSRSITYRNKTYRLKHLEGVRPGAVVKVKARPLVHPTVGVLWNGAEHLVEPVVELPALQGGFRADAVVIGQEYAAQAETLTQQAVKRFDNLAYGDERKKGQAPFAGLTVFGQDAAHLENLVPLPRVGTPVAIERDVVAQRLPVVALLKRAAAAAGGLSPALNAELRAAFGASVDVREAEAVVAAIAAGTDWRAALGGAAPEEAAL